MKFLRNDCDITNLSCLILFCGRSFDSLQVLAWHMSYAHQDISINSKANATCFLCGFKMSTAKVIFAKMFHYFYIFVFFCFFYI